MLTIQTNGALRGAPSVCPAEGPERGLLSFPVRPCRPAGRFEAGQFASGNILAHNGLSGFVRGWAMGLERGRYYTRSRKVNGRVVREYVGAGPVAELAAQLDALDRAQREAVREAQRAIDAELAEIDGPLNELDTLAEGLARAALLAAGYRRHKRGEWRKTRGGHQES